MLICFLQLIIIILAVISLLMIEGFWIDIPIYILVATIVFVIAKKYENKPKMKPLVGIILIFNCSIYVIVVILSGNAPIWYDILHFIVAMVSPVIIRSIRGKLA